MNYTINDEIINSSAQANINMNTGNDVLQNVNRNPSTTVIEDILNVNANSNLYSNMYNHNIGNNYDTANVMVHQQLNHANANTNMKSYSKENHIHNKNHQLNRNIPLHNATTNINDLATYKEVRHENELKFENKLPAHSATTHTKPLYSKMSTEQSKQINLPEMKKLGGFQTDKNVPIQERKNLECNLNRPKRETISIGSGTNGRNKMKNVFKNNLLF